MNVRDKRFWLLVEVVLLASVAGCGESADRWQRVAVSGQVSDAKFAKPEEVNGTITFLPTGSVNGPSAATGIVAGKYHFDASNGPVAGSHRVILQVIQPGTGPHARLKPKSFNPKTDPNARGGGKAVYFPDHLLTREVPAAGSQSFDFNIP